jgi:four helix bundle protein
MIIRRTEDLIVWQLASELERRVFAFTATPPVDHNGDFCRQIRKSASSAPRNIAEGFGRFWPAEFAHKLRIARGELRETHDHLGLAIDQKYIDVHDYAVMFRLADRAIGASTRLLRYLDSAGPDWKKGFLAAVPGTLNPVSPPAALGLLLRPLSFRGA